jgi:hypothetical protein
MLALDALDGDGPTVLVIVGTRTATFDPKPFYRGRQELVRHLRRRWVRQVEYSALCEFTTGDGRLSGGQRRPHWNIFLKGLPLADLDEIREVVREVWCRHVDAEPWLQYCEAIRDPTAAANYVAMHFQKEQQSPPVGWSGQRFNSSRRYYGDTTRAEMRLRARASLQEHRELHKAAKRNPEATPDELAAAAAIATARAAETTWQLVATSPRQAERLLAGQPIPPAPAARAPARDLAALGIPGPQ